jgi:mono/diheme cytochrome c family protein
MPDGTRVGAAHKTARSFRKADSPHIVAAALLLATRPSGGSEAVEFRIHLCFRRFMKFWKVAATVVVSVLILSAGGLAAGAQLLHDRVFDIGEVSLSASSDPELIAYGRYLVYGPAHCAYCHTPAESWPAIDAGETPPMAGGAPFSGPFGTIHSANITPDVETGIGAMSDGAIARMLRHNVKRTGRAAVPFMEYYELSDDDVVAILSYLRSTQPQRNAVPPAELTMIGKAIMAYMIKPRISGAAPPRSSPPADGSIARGEYLANNVANCAGCHTQRSMQDGSYIGPRFAGGMRLPSEADPDVVLVTPNLTPHPEFGVLAQWSEDMFVHRFRAGSVVEGTHMPWGAYRRMSDDDLRAIYRFLQTLDPVAFDPGPAIQTQD